MSLVKSGHSEHALALGSLVDRTRAYARAATTDRTKIAYAQQWRSFAQWCAAHGLASLPAEPATMAMYLSDRADEGRKVSTLAQACAAIVRAHKMAGFPTPYTDAVRDVMHGIRRLRGAPPVAKDALHPADMRALLSGIPDDLRGARDRALLLVGFLAGLRRSELVGLHVHHIRWTPEGFAIRLFGTKDDVALQGREVPVAAGDDPALCAAHALRTWLEHARIVDGPIFRSVHRYGRHIGRVLNGKDVARIVQQRAADAGLEIDVGGHSLRAGFVTSAHLNGATLPDIVKVTGHKSYNTAMRYIRKADLFENVPSKGLL